ncbi:MAG: DUF423 domain-containing protein [Bacteroidota bacterium]
MTKRVLLTASALGAFAVMIGAFGAHGLKPLLLENNRLDTFEIAVKYHFYHTFALIGLALIHERFQLKHVNVVFWFYLTGIVVFSGSLYILCLTNITVLGAITPLGGVLLIAGWFMLFWGIKKAG